MELANPICNALKKAVFQSGRRAEPRVAEAAEKMGRDALKLGKGPAPAMRNLWDRAAQADANGFYKLPVELCDDYENTELTRPVKAKIQNDFKTMKDLGVKDLRLGLSWTRVQPDKGEYDWKFWDYLVEQADKQGINLRPYICYTPEWVGDQTPDFWHHAPRDPKAFADFVETAARRYKGKIKSWELWNEPDNKAYWDMPGKTTQQSADAFANMLKPAIDRLRTTDPQAGIILGGMADGNSDFFRRVMEKHHLGNQVDTVNVHAYLRTWDGRPQEHLADYLNEARNIVASTTGKVKPALDLDEFGHSSHRFNQTQGDSSGFVKLIYKYEATPAYQGEALFKDHTIALANGQTSHVAWYRINDLPDSQGVIGDNNNHHLGLLDTSGRQKPAYKAFRFFRQLFDQPTRSLDGQARLLAGANSQAQVHVIEKQDGKKVLVGWLRDSRPEEVADKSGLATDTRRETVSVQLPGNSLGTVKSYDSHGKALSVPGLKLDGNTLKGIPLRGDRVFVAELS